MTATVLVELGGRARVACQVARTAAEQARGLQGHPGLADGEGLLFPFAPPRAVAFHMGTVAFPIDLVFADASRRVRRIVHAAMPGSRAVWSEPVTSAVLEVPGGYAARVGLGLGDHVRVAFDVGLGGASGHELPDAFAESDAESERHLLTPYDGQGEPPADDFSTRAPSLFSARRRRAFAQGLVEVDLERFAPAMVQAGLRAGLPWEPLVLNDRRERALIPPAELGRWIHALGLPEAQRGAVQDAATDAQVLKAIGLRFISEGHAQTANIGQQAHQPVLVLTRERRTARR